MSKQEAYNLLKAAKRPLTLEEVRAMLGTNRQSASRSLNRLRLDGDIKVDSFITSRGGSRFLYSLKENRQ